MIYNQHSSYITVDIANAFAESGRYDKIVLLAGVINEREEKLNEKVRVVKTLPYNKVNIFTRFFSWFFSFFHFLFLTKLRYRSHRLFLVSNPPLVSFFPYFGQNQYSALIFDVYPDALSSGKFVSEKSLIYRLWEKANLKFFQKAEKVFTISEGMKNRISKYCDPSKIKTVSLWSSFSPLSINREENRFIQNKRLLNQFIVMYSGNMGKGGCLDSIIEVAEKLQDEKNLLFLFVGGGWNKPILEKKAKDKKLSNCLFLPYQDVSILKHSLSAADIALVDAPPSTSNISIPNKTYTLIALGRPLLCISNPESDLSQLVNKYKIGECFNKNETEKMSTFILKAKNNQTFSNQLKENAINCARHFTKENAGSFVH